MGFSTEWNGIETSMEFNRESNGIETGMVWNSDQSGILYITELMECIKERNGDRTNELLQFFFRKFVFSLQDSL